MTQVFDPETGAVTSVTVDRGGPVPRRPGEDARELDGYEAVQLAFDAVAERKLSKPELGHLKRFGVGAAPQARRVPRPDRRRRRGRDASRSRTSSRATRSRSPASGSARASRARSSGTTSRAARARTARTTSASRARSARPPRRRVSSRASRWPAAWAASASRRSGLTVHEVDLERNLLLVKGSVPGPKNGIVEVRG